MINRVVLVGRITKDPVMRKTNSGMSVVSFTVACNRRFSGNNNEQQADFISCTAWNKTADFMNQYVRKGALIGVEGRIQTGSYDDQSGRKVYTTDVVCESVQLLESKGASQERREPAGQPQQFAGYNNTYQNQNTYDQNNSFNSDFSDSDTLDIASDDLPF
ncbi:MAG: single-stranded DNA-binding protein [Erysipelotrichaceae bacterium]